MSGDAGGFLARWSRRKAGRAEAAEATPGASLSAPEAVAAAAAEAVPATAGPATDPQERAPVLLQSPEAAPAPEAAPLPTMEDVAALTRSSDYSRFVGPGVEPGVSNAAMKKLFSDPHFNVMDGLDTYIDDYGKPDPIPPSMLRLMNQAATLGLFDDVDAEVPPGRLAPGTAPAQACPDGSGEPALAASKPPLPQVPEPAPDRRADDDPDLRLQPDDAARCGDADPGSRA